MKFRRLLALAFAAAFTWARSEVTRVEITARSDVGSSGYEKIVGRIHFAIDPKDPRNAVIADVGRAAVNAAGRVEFSSDLYLLRPKAPGAGNGAALVEVSNRGGRSAIVSFNRGGSRDPATETDLGDGFLQRQGFTLVWVGWEFDVPSTKGLMRIAVPVATNAGKVITGMVRGKFSVSSRVGEYEVTDLAAYPPHHPEGVERELARRIPGGGRTVIPPDHWRLRGHTVILTGGFEPGTEYEVSYAAANPPIAGLGFAALRDTTSWLKHGSDSPAPVRHAYAFGSSQSGRFLRDFLYHGFNTDERDRQVYDGVLAHIAGAARINLNHRWSVPRELGTYSVTGFPFADTAQTDPVGGSREGLLENPRVRHAPKIFYTNTSVEYWGGGRVAALVHTDPAGTKDVPLPDNVRFYAFAGTQHGPAKFPPPAATTAQQRANPVDFWWTMRALLPAMHRWVNDGTPPPASAYPTFRDGTLVPAAALDFPAIPGLRSPRALNGGVRISNPLLSGKDGAGAPLPLLVSQVDADGNERGGIRLPDVAAPLATYTGWNFRAPTTGAPDELVSLAGSWIPFPATREAREAAGDPRKSIGERYASRADYLLQYRAAAEDLARRGLLLTEDMAQVVKRAGEQWDFALALSRRATP